MRWTVETVASALGQAGGRTIASDPEAKRWLTLIDEAHAELVLERVDGVPWKLICWRFGISRATAYRRWRHALSIIAWHLNGCAIPTRCSRRRFMQLAASSM